MPEPLGVSDHAAKSCCVCGKNFTEYVESGGKRYQPCGALDVEIRGIYGSTVFDETDFLGTVMTGYVCDPCGERMFERMAKVQKYPDRTIKPGSSEAKELLQAISEPSP